MLQQNGGWHCLQTKHLAEEITLNTPCLMPRCIAADRTPARRGEANQLATMVSKPGYPQCTHAVPAPTTVMPSTAPTMACVVDTGMPTNVASSMNRAPDNRAHAMPAGCRLSASACLLSTDVWHWKNFCTAVSICNSAYQA